MFQLDLTKPDIYTQAQQQEVPTKPDFYPSNWEGIGAIIGIVVILASTYNSWVLSKIDSKFQENESKAKEYDLAVTKDTQQVIDRHMSAIHELFVKLEGSVSNLIARLEDLNSRFVKIETTLPFHERNIQAHDQSIDSMLNDLKTLDSRITAMSAVIDRIENHLVKADERYMITHSRDRAD